MQAKTKIRGRSHKDEISKNTLNMIDKSMKNLAKGIVGKPIDLKEMENPFYGQGKALKELGECLMNIDTKIDTLAEKANACGFNICFSAVKNSPKIKKVVKTKNKSRMEKK